MSAATTVRVSLVVSLVLCVACAVPQPPAWQPGVIWVGDAESGDLSQFKDTPWNTDGGGRPPEIVAEPGYVRDGQYAIRTAIVSAGRPDDGICCGSRSELEPSMPDIRPGDDLYFGISTLLEDGFPVHSGWQTITQWHDDAAGSPPLELSVQAGQYSLSGGFGHPDESMAFNEPLGQAMPGRWVDWIVHIVFSPDPEVGYVEIWQDGNLVLPRFHPDSGTMYPSTGSPSVYLKVGYYRDPDISAPGRIYYDSMRVGTTRTAVSRRSG